MRKIMAGILLAGTIMSLPITAQAHERQCPKTIEVTQKEAEELLNIAWCEAGNQGELGQLYVMSVIINRVNSPDFPDTIHEVIYQDHQFATRGMSTAQPTSETHMALADLEMGTLIPEIVAFEKSSSDSLDKYFTEAFDYRDHTFYTAKIN